MSSNNPSITAATIVTEIEALLGTPSVSTTVYLPWISYAYQQTYAKLASVNQRVKERLFGNYTAVTLTNGTAEYTLSTILPRFASVIKLEILYGGTSDLRSTLKPLPSIANWNNQSQVSTSYRSKADPYYYLLQDTIGIIPTPPASDSSQAILYAWYVRRPFQITEATDVIDIPYRFLYPLLNFVQAKAIQKVNEDYSEAAAVLNEFRQELEEVAIAADSENNENAEESVRHIDTAIYDDPFSL